MRFKELRPVKHFYEKIGGYIVPGANGATLYEIVWYFQGNKRSQA